jgi:hypothetical protein
MLFRHLLNDQLEKKRDEFVRYFDEQAHELRFYTNALARLEKSSIEEIRVKLAGRDDFGAMPADELEKHKSFVSRFEQVWQNHEQARRWAGEILEDRTTFAADGSQIFAGKETSMPVAAIQIGWFENPHNESLDYEKNADFEILSPEELLKGNDEPINPETRVGERRFHGEVAKVGEFISRKQGWKERGEKMPLAFFDGTLLVSFGLPRTVIQESFIQAMVNLVRHSRNSKVPLVGYVDRSFARDLTTLLETADSSERAAERTLYDAAILFNADLLSSWGDRTCFCYSHRAGLGAFNDKDGKSIVGFSYLKTAVDAPPSRLDIPAWVYDEGLLDETIDVIRAECVIGLGYPYAAETADQAAVMSSADRDIFLRALQELAAREKLGFSVSRKATSKARRR